MGMGKVSDLNRSLTKVASVSEAQLRAELESRDKEIEALKARVAALEELFSAKSRLGRPEDLETRAVGKIAKALK